MSNSTSIEEVKKIPPKELLKIINDAKKYLLNDKVWLRICKENDINPEIIYLIPTRFGTLDVSAKTDHGIIILNYKLLCGNFEKNYSYLIHEYSHWTQQALGNKPTKSSDDGNYLMNPYEQEGFSNQVEFIANHHGDDEAKKYVDHLLKYHDVEKDEKPELEDILLEKV